MVKGLVFLGLEKPTCGAKASVKWNRHLKRHPKTAWGTSNFAAGHNNCEIASTKHNQKDTRSI